jgi:hypothetical protein
MSKAKVILTQMYEDFNDDYFYFYNLLFYVATEPINDQVKGYYEISYEKNDEQVAKDSVTLLKFMVSTGDFKIVKDFFVEELAFLPEAIETDENMDILESPILRMRNQEKGFHWFSSIYQIVRLNEDAKVPDHIPDEIVAIFKKV